MRRKMILKGLLALAASLVLAGCGGGERAEAFTPTRLYAFGDELSALESDGRKYGVNYADSSTGALDCSQYPLWIQTLASNYGMAFEQCPGSYTRFDAVTRASAGAKVADVQQQVSAYLLNDNPSSAHLVAMLAGTNDVLAAYAGWVQGGRDAEAYANAGEAVKFAATLLARQVYLVVLAGAPVLVSEIADLGYAPYAQGEETLYPGEGRAAMLSTLSTAFNDALRSGDGGLASYSLTGADYGLIMDGTTWATGVAQGTSAASYNATPLCLATAPLPNCTSLTLATGADVDYGVWADATRPGVAYQAKLGSRAVTLATNLPF